MFNIYNFSSTNEVQHFLNGGLTGKPIPMEGIRGLVGKTITFTSPVGSCTFVEGGGPDGGALLFKDIKTQLEAAVSGLKVMQFSRGVIGFISSDASVVTSLGATAQDARALLGLPRGGAISGKLVLPPTDAGTPRLVQAASGADQYFIYIWE
jgi:hypothetical protein